MLYSGFSLVNCFIDSYIYIYIYISSNLSIHSTTTPFPFGVHRLYILWEWRLRHSLLSLVPKAVPGPWKVMDNVLVILQVYCTWLPIWIFVCLFVSYSPVDWASYSIYSPLTVHLNSWTATHSCSPCLLSLPWKPLRALPGGKCQPSQ